jgi:hypothetical protein
MTEAVKQFRKVNGFLHLPALREALDRYVAGVTTIDESEEHVARGSQDRHPKFHGTRDILRSRTL